MAELAAETRRVRVGCLVFCVCYRPVGVLAKAAVTIDHVSGGRCELGIGAGWNEIESRAFGIPFPSIRERLDLLEESAAVLRRLFDGERVTFAGRQVQLTDALCDPRPVQTRLRLWIGGERERPPPLLVAPHARRPEAPLPPPQGFAPRAIPPCRSCARAAPGPPASPPDAHT